jgi:hypothetical protein
MASSRKRGQYLAFLESPEKLPLGEPVAVFIKDLSPGRRKYDTRFVRAIIYREDEPLTGSDELILSSLAGKCHTDNLTIRIIEELGEYVRGVPYNHHTGIFTVQGEKR